MADVPSWLTSDTAVDARASLPRQFLAVANLAAALVSARSAVAPDQPAPSHAVRGVPDIPCRRGSPVAQQHATSEAAMNDGQRALFLRLLLRAALLAGGLLVLELLPGLLK